LTKNDHITAIGDTALSLMPEEGETIIVKGGLGNKSLNQTKRENGKFYERKNEDEKWVEVPDYVWRIYQRMSENLMKYNKTKNENCTYES
jgi:hypothetical protein